jgi:hypothetical protein
VKLDSFLDAVVKVALPEGVLVFMAPRPIMGKEVKCTLVQALRLCTGRKAHRASRGIALLFYDHGTRSDKQIYLTFV